MVFREILEVQRTIRTLNEKLRGKPKGYATEFKINGHVFPQPREQKIEIILVDPQKNLVAYRPNLDDVSNNHHEKWLIGNYEKAVKDAFALRNRKPAENSSPESHSNESRSPMEDSKDPELTLMGFF